MKSNPPALPINGIDYDNLPRHIAVIMDGNGRWAKKRLLNRVIGHEKGMEAVRSVIQTSRKLGVQYLTLYAFSTENWQRPKAEIAALMNLLRRFIVSEREEIHHNNIQVRTIGQVERLPQDIQDGIADFMQLTRNNNGMVLNLALSYGGRQEILRSVQQIASLAAQGLIRPDMISEETIAEHLYTQGAPDPDMLIRTSGEMRISNFLLWQIAYTEIFVVDTLWPDFGEPELIETIKAYQQRQRRFGTIKED